MWDIRGAGSVMVDVWMFLLFQLDSLRITEEVKDCFAIMRQCEYVN